MQNNIASSATKMNQKNLKKKKKKKNGSPYSSGVILSQVKIRGAWFFTLKLWFRQQSSLDLHVVLEL